MPNQYVVSGFSRTLCRIFFNAVNRRDVWMIQRRQQLRLALEPGEPIGVGREHFRQNFDGDVPMASRIAGAIYLAHPAGADERDDFVGAETHAGR
jgi:hypothetical protein